MQIVILIGHKILHESIVIIGLAVLIYTLAGIVQESYKSLFQRVSGYSIGVSICEIVVISLMKFGIALPNFIYRNSVFYSGKGNIYIIQILCYAISIINGFVFYNYCKVSRRYVLLLCCIAQVASSCIILNFSSTFASVSMIFASVAYAAGVYKYFKANFPE